MPPVTVPTRPLGSTGVVVTALGYGAMELRGAPRGPEIKDEEAGRLLNALLDGGINLIDTSIDYGRSEELIGRYLADRREEYFLASKCGCLLELAPEAIPPYPHDFRAQNVRAGSSRACGACVPTASTSSRSTCHPVRRSSRRATRSRRWWRFATRARSASSGCPEPSRTCPAHRHGGL